MSNPTPDYEKLALQIKTWGQELGFSEVGITDIDLSKHEAQLQRWLDAGYHGSMDYMAAHGMKRARPAELVPGTQRVISVKMNYLPPDAGFAKTLKNKEKEYKECKLKWENKKNIDLKIELENQIRSNKKTIEAKKMEIKDNKKESFSSLKTHLSPLLGLKDHKS